MNQVQDQATIHSSPPTASTLRVTTISHESANLSTARMALILAVVTFLGAALRLHLLAARSLWIDEASSVHFATMPRWPFLRLLWTSQGNMTLYYFLLRAWIHLGDSEFVVRSLSVLFGVLTIPAIYMLGMRLFDRATGVTAAALLSVHSFHIHWSQETRAYSLLTLLLVLTTYALISAMESNQERRHWIAFAVAAVLCVYAHIFAVLVLAGYALVIMFPRPFSVGVRTIIFPGVVFAFLVAPMAAFVLLHRDGGPINWIPQPTLAEISEFLELLTGQGGIFLVVIYLALCSLAVLYSTKTTWSEKEGWAIRLLALWLVLPVLLTLGASLIKPVFYPRYMVMCVPALVILAARGLTRLYDVLAVKYWAGAAALVLVLALSGWGIHRYFEGFATEASDWRSAVSYILEHQQPGDGAVFFIPNTYPYLYYTHRAESQHSVTKAPAVLYPPTPWRPVSRDEVRSVTTGRERVWLILHLASDRPRESTMIQSALAETFQLHEQRVFTDWFPFRLAMT